MKRIVVYYSLSGNTQKAAEKLAELLGTDIVRLETARSMPKSYPLQIVVGGGQVMMGSKPKLKPLEKDLTEYDEIILGTPVWNSKAVPAVNTLLKDKKIAKKVTGVFTLSQGGDMKKCMVALSGKLPRLMYSASLLDQKMRGSKHNKEKLEQFAEMILG